ncbi:MAG: ABC transporter ATP-binding protein, partial [Candidatus Thiodiazotropha sp.]
IILTTHYLEEAERLCHNIAIIDHGRIVEQTSMTRLLSQLHTEVFLLNMAAPINRAPDLHDYRTTLVDSDTLEVEVDREQSMNQLFRLLSAQGIEIVSMRNKQNRLEQMFVDLVDGSKEKHA